ncbi:autotransporter outer membrane beta-barrel domain-containing protein [Bartonella schoenbuchensis]
MHKKSLLLSTAVAIVLFSAHLNAHAGTLSSASDDDPQVVSGESYQATGEGKDENAVSATAGGKIDGTKLTLTGKGDKGRGAYASGSGSVIDLKDNTTIKEVTTGLKAEDSGMITMTGGSIDAAKVAVGAITNGVITLNNVEKITSKEYGLLAGSEAQITMTGGSIDATKTAVWADDKGIINLNGVEITSKDFGLLAKNESQITMNGGSIKATDKNAAVKSQHNSVITLNGAVTIESKTKGLSADNAATIIMNGGSIDVTGEKGVAVESEGKSTVELNNGVKITSKNVGLLAKNGAQIVMNGGSIEATKTAVKSKSSIELNNVEVTSEDVGLVAESEAQITMTGGSIDVTGESAAVNVKKKGTVNLNGVAITSKAEGLSAKDEEAQITMVGGKVSGKNTVYAKDGGQIALTNVAVTSNQGFGLFAEGENTKVTMNGGSVTAIAGDDPHTQEDGVAFYVKEGGQIDTTNVSATADKIGLELHNQEKGDNKVNFTNTKLIVKNGIGIYLTDVSHDEDEEQENLRSSEERAPKVFNNNITLKNSEIRADVLLTATDKAKATITADHSILEGRVGTGEEGNIIFDLNNGSQWILKASKTEKGEKDQLAPIANRSHSDISVLNLNDSSIIFDGPTEGHYQTLQVGTGKDVTKEVYNATGNAKLYLNAEWSDGKKIDEQKADHLLIKGDVSGSTAVYVNVQGNATEASSFVPWNKRGISLIQVSGTAKEDSFKLANGYTTVGGSPYKYTLNAYGPESSKGSANADQMLIEKDPAVLDGRDEGNKGDDFWDFRLQNQYLANLKVKALVPQMANYLVMPSALFSTGFTDIENQNALLTDIRAAMPWNMENDKRNPFFLSSYGSKATLSSNRTGLEYGYGADIGYAAIQTGVALAALESQNISSYFGLLGTYGKLSFTPQNMADVDKTALEKWGITAYSSVQHNSGVYLNALLSYGFLKGNVFNAVIGRTAKLDDANTWSASATLGKKLTTSAEGLVFEPQMQIAYQQLLLGSIQDADNFKVDMGNPHQWAVRMGGRLTKNVNNRVEDGHLFSFYGKLNLISTFGNEGTIRVGDSFRLDSMGSAIEGGVGVNAQLFQNIALHGDISYQQKLQKAGISGATLSGGLKYRF